MCQHAKVDNARYFYSSILYMPIIITKVDLNMDLTLSYNCKLYSLGCIVCCSDYIKPAKVFINEEKMSAKMNSLHLDNNNLDRHPDLEQQPWYSHQIG
jgi:hypothetical protein